MYARAARAERRSACAAVLGCLRAVTRVLRARQVSPGQPACAAVLGCLRAVTRVLRARQFVVCPTPTPFAAGDCVLFVY